MKFDTPLEVKWIAEFTKSKIIGNATLQVLGINEIHKVQPGDLTYVDVEKYYKKCLESDATFIFINKEIEAPEGKVLLYHSNPFEAYNSVVKYFIPLHSFEKNEKNEIGEGTWIHPTVVIGENCKIGKNCIIYPNVVLYDNTIIEDNVIIHSGAIIGADAFYYKKNAKDEIHYTKMLSCGSVIIRSNVEIGACTTIDKGVSGDTIIGHGTKIDNHVHIGHGVVIGKNVLIAAQVGIGGKTIIEDGVMIWGQVGINKDVRIGKNAELLAQSGVASSLEGGQKYFGSPAGPARQMMKQMMYIKNKNK